jgi:hypothetical protein
MPLCVPGLCMNAEACGSACSNYGASLDPPSPKKAANLAEMARNYLITWNFYAPV